MRMRPRDLVSVARMARWPVRSLTSREMVHRLWRLGIRPATTIDIGANRGQFTVAAAEILHPSALHAIEPIPEMVARLRGFSARYPGLVVHSFAAGDGPGEAQLRLNSHSQASSVLELDKRHLAAFPEARQIDVTTVPVRRVDEILDPANLARPLLVKIDVQGYEVPVLAGLSGFAGKIDHMVIEISLADLYRGGASAGEVLSSAERLGLRSQAAVGQLSDSHTREILQIDVLLRIGASNREAHNEPISWTGGC